MAKDYVEISLEYIEKILGFRDAIIYDDYNDNLYIFQCRELVGTLTFLRSAILDHLLLLDNLIDVTQVIESIKKINEYCKSGCELSFSIDRRNYKKLACYTTKMVSIWSSAQYSLLNQNKNILQMTAELLRRRKALPKNWYKITDSFSPTRTLERIAKRYK